MQNQKHESGIEKINGFTIFTEKGTQTGVFFRSILKNSEIGYDEDLSDFFCNEYIDKVLKHPILKWVSKIINPHITIEKLEECECDSGFYIKWFTSPVYFKRWYRKLEAKGDNVHIVSFGYEDENINCGGACNKEKTKLIVNGIKRKYVQKDCFHYTYSRHIEKLLKNL